MKNSPLKKRNVLLHKQFDITHPVVVDCTYRNDLPIRSSIIFIHGFKGFKDWGPFNLMAEYFANQGFMFIKFNLSHNGTTPENPTEFEDLEAFGNNNFSLEMEDLQLVIDSLFAGKFSENNSDLTQLPVYLMGHSRGASLAILKAAEEARVEGLISMAAVADLEKRYASAEIEEWRKTGVLYVQNSRTNQMMPLYFQLYMDFMANRERFNVQKALSSTKCHVLLIHGDQDTSVSVNDAYDLKAARKDAELKVVKGADHSFGGTHPYTQNELPSYLNEVCAFIVSVLNPKTL